MNNFGSIAPVKLLVCIVFAIAVAMPAFARVKEVRDWIVYCDEDLTCRMQTDNQENGLYVFGFSRAPKANAPTIPFLSADDGYGNASRIAIEVDGEEYFLDPEKAEKRDGSLYFTNQNPEHQILKALMRGKKAKIIFEQPLGLRTINISVSGATGSALYMDEAQQRLDQTDALKAVGSKTPDDAISKVAKLNSAKDLPASVLAVWQANKGECSEDYDGGDLITRFGGQRIAGSEEANDSLFVLPCGGPGAYNLPMTAIAHEGERGFARRLYFPRMTPEGPTVMDTAINTYWDPVSETLSAFAKGRGLGDCGLASEWKWGGFYYGEFVLVEEREKDECDGVDSVWPRTWPLK